MTSTTNSNTPDAPESTPTSSSPRIAIRGKNDPAWGYCKDVSSSSSQKGKQIQCIFCLKVLSGGGIHRFKQHLAKIQGNAEPCKKVPDDIRYQMQQLINDHAHSRKRMRDMLNEQNPHAPSGEEGDDQNQMQEVSPTPPRPSKDKGKQGDTSVQRKVGSFFQPRTTPGAQPTIKCVLQSKQIVEKHIHSKKRNRLEHQRLNDLVYVHCNLKLQQRNYMKGRNYDPINHEMFDTNGTWVLEDEPPTLSNEELEAFRRDLERCVIQENEKDDELNLDELDVGNDEEEEVNDGQRRCGEDECPLAPSNEWRGEFLHGTNIVNQDAGNEFGTDWSAWNMSQ